MQFFEWAWLAFELASLAVALAILWETNRFNRLR